ncbi:flagellin [Comamonas kerstersii]|uniref:Flagellin n=1 Tax=Comamonas kerstersii TaxID=225992 RepID=A0A6A1R0C4_9BURK|nr:flagellin [Comamonas kerstersii]KAB0585735.1 flagellin [Comamonas kerstersii]
MAMTINTNVVSINSQRNLSLSGNSLATSMQRLSSGLRVNSAKDDAAGLAISERMKAQSSGLAVAARNANDGISLAQTAEGALGKVGDMLQRMRELAVQSSNATNSDNDRKAMQAEVTQLIAEIDRVAKTSEFNGTKLLNGDFAGGVFQVGAAAGDNITVGALTNVSANKLSTIAYATAEMKVADFGTNLKAGTLTYNGVEKTVGEASSAKERAGDVIALINSQSASTGLTAFLEDDGDTITLLSGGVVATANVVLKTNETTPATVTMAITATALATTGLTGIQDVSVKTQSDAWVALKKIDESINQVNTARGDLGALQTRFEKSIENIDIMNENISAARGRIVDADFAAETANLSRSQILQQAGTAMVAQANQLPQNVLSLLR